MLQLVLIVLFLGLAWGFALWADLPLLVPSLISVAVAFVAGLRFLWKRRQAAKGAESIERSLMVQADAHAANVRPDRRPELQALHQEFQHAITTLKKSKLGRGRSGALYALPWYVIVGPPGAGKSTALRNSGLNFPVLSKRGGVRGVGGTRNCDWWLSNEAVILDTAGRYATRPDDRDEWLGFLRMLARARSKRPINGILLAVSIADLGGYGEQAITEHAHTMRERLDEIIDELGLVAPVYVLLTKCDLIPGFVEVYGDLRRGERDQIWGFTLEQRDLNEGIEPALEHHFAPLVQVAERVSFNRLGDLRTVEERSRAYRFAHQLEALLPQAQRFISEVFARNVYKDTPWLRGIYFTSGTQEGNPIDHVMQAMAAAFGLSQAPSPSSPRSDPKSYFLGDVFRSVLFADEKLAHSSSTSVWRGRMVQAGTAVVLLLAASAFGALTLASYTGNASMVRQAATSLERLKSLRQAGASIGLAELDPLHRLLNSLHTHRKEGAPVRLGWGLYQGDELLPLVDRVYTKTLREGVIGSVFHDVHSRLTEQIRAHRGLEATPGVREHAEVYDLLKAYLLLSEPKAEHEPSLTPALGSWLRDFLIVHWARNASQPPSPDDRARMASHVDAYLELSQSQSAQRFSRDVELVRGARALLARVPTVRLAVDRLVAEMEPLDWDITLDKLLGSAALPLQGIGRVQGAFTRRAWETHLRDVFEDVPEGLLGEAWVLEGVLGEGDGRLEQDRVCQLRSQYFERYLQQWKQFVGSLRMEEPPDNARALVVLQDLTRGQPPPLQRVMRAVSYNARLDPKPEDPTLKAAKDKAAGVLERIKQAVADTPAADLLNKKSPCEGSDYVTAADVRRALRGFYEFGVAETTDQAAEAAGAVAQYTSVEVYQEQLVFLRDALQAYEDDPASSDALLTKLAAARTRVRGLIESQEVGWRPRFDALLWPPINGTFVSSANRFAGERGSRWCTSVYSPFKRSLQDRYPFVRGGQDAALADLVEFFQPDSGVVWSFYDATLAKDVPRVGERFALKGGSGVSSLYTGELVSFLGRAQEIATVLFPRRAQEPRVDFEVRVRPSPGIASVLLTIDGQEIDFHNGPEKWIAVRWPGGGEKPGAVMRVIGAGIDETLQQSGPWGWFRLLDKSIISASPGERFFTARWKLRTQNDVVVDVRPARVENPFIGSKKFLEAFRSEGSTPPERIAESAAGCPE